MPALDEPYTIAREGDRVVFARKRPLGRHPGARRGLGRVILLAALAVVQAALLHNGRDGSLFLTWFLLVSAFAVSAIFFFLPASFDKYRGRALVRERVELRLADGVCQEVVIDGDTTLSARRAGVFRTDWVASGTVAGGRARRDADAALVLQGKVFVLERSFRNSLSATRPLPSEAIDALVETFRGALGKDVPAKKALLTDWSDDILGMVLACEGFAVFVLGQFLTLGRQGPLAWVHVASTMLAGFGGGLITFAATFYVTQCRVAAAARSTLSAAYKTEIEPVHQAFGLNPWLAFVLAAALQGAYSLLWLKRWL